MNKRKQTKRDKIESFESKKRRAGKKYIDSMSAQEREREWGGDWSWGGSNDHKRHFHHTDFNKYNRKALCISE